MFCTGWLRLQSRLNIGVRIKNAAMHNKAAEMGFSTKMEGSPPEEINDC
jgi:hypothetical protein